MINTSNMANTLLLPLLAVLIMMLARLLTGKMLLLLSGTNPSVESPNHPSPQANKTTSQRKRPANGNGDDNSNDAW